MNKDKLKIFDTPQQLAESFSNYFKNEINSKESDYYLSISGGSTPKLIFNELAQVDFNQSINWKKAQIFWCDERCVPPTHPESNYGATKKILFDKIEIPESNVHRIKGEAEPSKEAVRYAMDIEKILCDGKNCVPVFDWILLGLGEDGHTASLFPGKTLLFLYSNIVGVTQHPVTGQKRISLTKEVLNNAKKVTFIVTGKEKARVLSEIINGLPMSKNYPAAEIKPDNGTLEWIVDKEAAFYL